MIPKGYNIETKKQNEKKLNNTNEYGFNLGSKQEVDVFKQNIRHRNMTNFVKSKGKR